MAATSATSLELPLLGPYGRQQESPARPHGKDIRGVHHWGVKLGHDIWTDLKTTDWGWGGKAVWLPLYLVLTVVFTQLCLMLGLTESFLSSRGQLDGITPRCLPDGSFGNQYNAWAISGLFQITIRRGSLTFTEAKLIDMAWDVFVGRVGQSIMAYYSWKAFSAYIRVSMESRPVTFDTFFTTHLEQAASLESTLKMIRDFSTRKSLRSRVAMVSIIMTMAFVLAWPTLAAAMTGYTTAESAYVFDKDGNLIFLSEVYPLAYVIHDGDRIGLFDDYLVAYDIELSFFEQDRYFEQQDPCIKAYSTGPCGLALARNVSKYVENYGFLGLDSNGAVHDIQTKWGTTTLRPALNISAFYIPDGSVLHGYSRNNTIRPNLPASNSSNTAFTQVDLNGTYSNQYMKDNGVCQAGQTATYQWGFSFLQLFIDLLLLFFWVIEIWVLWYVAHRELDIEVSGRYRAVLDLAAAISLHQDTPTLTSRQLTKHIKTQLKGGALKAGPPGALGQGLREGI